jgi:hypothetical protein
MRLQWSYYFFDVLLADLPLLALLLPPLLAPFFAPPDLPEVKPTALLVASTALEAASVTVLTASLAISLAAPRTVCEELLDALFLLALFLLALFLLADLPPPDVFEELLLLLAVLLDLPAPDVDFFAVAFLSSSADPLLPFFAAMISPLDELR